MDRVHMQQEIDGTPRDMHVHPDAVALWEKSGWSVVADDVSAPVTDTTRPARVRAATTAQEG